MTKPLLKRILLVEDNHLDVELILTALEEHNLAGQVVVVRDGADALDYLLQRGAFADRSGELPAVVLLDLKMPRLDGLEVLGQMKQHPALKRIPVVMMTSSREEPDLIKSYELGVNAYVVKPVNFHEFADSMKHLAVFWAMVNEPPPASACKTA